MPDTPTPEKHSFQAEVAAVLKLVTNSLYTNREIFLRELISNASDALDKARFTALVDSSLEGQELEPEIRITADKTRGVLTIEDTGIGMTREEAAKNLGTIAHSGTLRFLEAAAEREAEGKKPDLSLIGQFGVGFYSVFMVADRVDVYSRSGENGSEPVHWSSDGSGEFTVAPTERDTRGTKIEITLKEEAKEYLDRFRIEHIVKRYSNFVMYPIRFKEIDPEAKEEAEWVQLNEIGAFWQRNPSELSDDDYKDFYKHVMGGFVMPGDEPLGRLHLSMDAPIQFKAVLFVPGRRPADLFGEESRNLQLYARRVMVMDSCDKLLPVYLRFMRGVVDSEDLPLNVSRETLQENKAISAIRRQLTRKTLKLLEDTAKEDRAKYEQIFSEFGVFLKEGLHIDSGHKEQLADLLRFHSSGHEPEWISLQEYVDTMKDGQEAIYYITGHSKEDLERSPHLEAVRDKGYAVLLMTDAVDEWVVQDLREYKGKPLRSVTQGDLDLGDKAADESDNEGEEPTSSEIEPLLERAKEVLGERVKDVRASNRLRSSASCLVDAEGSIGRNMERILKMAGRDIVSRPRVLELNPEHPFVKATNALVREGDADQAAAFIELLHDQANLAEGQVPDPAGMVKRIQAILDQAVSSE
jgi:molecular chaperone HtpG